MTKDVQNSFFSFISFHESISTNITNQFLSSFVMTLKLWFEKIDNSKFEYKNFRKILQIVNSDLKIFLKLNILKKQIRKRLSLLRFLRKIIFVTYEKQSSISIENKKKQIIHKLTWLYWFNSRDLISKILSIEKLRQRMHFDMIQYRN